MRETVGQHTGIGAAGQMKKGARELPVLVARLPVTTAARVTMGALRYTTPWASMASATFTKPATLAPSM